MNVEQNEYLGDLTRDAGIRVQIEDKRKVPFPYEKGFSVGPGSATSVGIRKVSHDKEINLLIYNMYIWDNCAFSFGAMKLWLFLLFCYF